MVSDPSLAGLSCGGDRSAWQKGAPWTSWEAMEASKNHSILMFHIWGWNLQQNNRQLKLSVDYFQVFSRMSWINQFLKMSVLSLEAWSQSTIFPLENPRKWLELNKSTAIELSSLPTKVTTVTAYMLYTVHSKPLEEGKSYKVMMDGIFKIYHLYVILALLATVSMS